MKNLKLSSRYLLMGALLTIWCAALSGFALPLDPQALLALHLISGVGGMVPIAAYLRQHWWARRHTLKAHDSHSVIQGYVALICLALLALTGLTLIRWTNVPALRWLHTGATVVLLLDLTAHVALRLRQRAINTQAPPSLSPAYAQNAHSPRRWLVSSLVAACIVGVLVLITRVSATPDQEIQVSIEHASLGTSTLARAQDCAPCHSAITQQWQRSGHAHAATGAYYQAVTTLYMQERGVEAVRFCATCHNPIGLMQGEVDVNAAQNVKADSDLAYQARKLGIDLPISQAAAEGVTCALCHQVARVAESPSNGSLELDVNAFELPVGVLSRMGLRAVPDDHRDALLPPVIQQAELCGSCHNLRLPDSGMLIEGTFDEWKDSPYPARGITCQTCHLAPVLASRADSGLPQAIKAHGVMPGAPSSLPEMANDITLLKKAATLNVSAALNPDDPSVVMATVTITNSGAGHDLPTGASDLRQVWLEVKVRDATGQVVWSSGELDEYGQLDPTAVQFHKVLGDERGRPIELHRIWAATQILENTSLKPMETRRIPYRIALPTRAQAPFTLTVRLLYQDVSRAFAEFALEHAVSADSLPMHEMAQIAIAVGQ